MTDAEHHVHRHGCEKIVAPPEQRGTSTPVRLVTDAEQRVQEARAALEEQVRQQEWYSTAETMVLADTYARLEGQRQALAVLDDVKAKIRQHYLYSGHSLAPDIAAIHARVEAGEFSEVRHDA